MIHTTLHNSDSIKGKTSSNNTMEKLKNISTDEEEIDLIMLKGLFESNELRRMEKLSQLEQQLFVLNTSNQADLMILQTKVKKLLDSHGIAYTDLSTMHLDENEIVCNVYTYHIYIHIYVCIRLQ